MGCDWSKITKVGEDLPDAPYSLLSVSVEGGRERTSASLSQAAASAARKRDKRKADARELRGDGKHSSVTLPVASAPGQAGPPGPKLVKPKLDVDSLCPPPHHSAAHQRQSSAETNKENDGEGRSSAASAPRPATEPVGGLAALKHKFSLDLAKTLEAPRPPTEKQLRTEKLARYDKECTEVLDWLYVGGLKVAENKELLVGMGITHIVNACAPTTANLFPDTFEYRAVFINDAPGEDIVAHLYPVLAFLEEVRASKRRVLVHCTQGVSRSCSMCIAYLMLHHRKGYEEAFSFVKERRGVCNPNPGFSSQIIKWGRRVAEHASRASHEPPARSPRIFRMDHYYPADPRAGVAPLPVPSGSSLSSGSVYVVEGAEEVVVWVGKAAGEDKEAAAREHVAALQRFEGAPSRVETQLEGEESEALVALLVMLGCSLASGAASPPAFPSGGLECAVATPRNHLALPPFKMSMPSTGLVEAKEGGGGEEEAREGGGEEEEGRRFRMFEIPSKGEGSFEELDNFDSDDLWPSKAFLLLPGEEGEQDAVVWIGEEFSGVSDLEDEEECVTFAQTSARAFSEEVGIAHGKVKVVVEGSEPEDFWEFFELG